MAVTLRSNAGLNENTTMRTPLSIEDYLGSRYIVRPMRLYDMCLVNDGAVCLIVTGADRARDLRHTPVWCQGGGAHRLSTGRYCTTWWPSGYAPPVSRRDPKHLEWLVSPSPTSITSRERHVHFRLVSTSWRATDSRRRDRAWRSGRKVTPP